MRHPTHTLSGEALWQLLKHNAEQASAPETGPHDVRRSFGTKLAAKGIRLVQQVLDHKDIDTTAK